MVSQGAWHAEQSANSEDQRQRDKLNALVLSTAAEDVIAERARQKSVEGWTDSHDDAHELGELARAAACYAMNSAGLGDDEPVDPQDRGSKWVPRSWPWSAGWWKPKTARENLVRAGALILAEIERLDRAAALKRARGDNPLAAAPLRGGSSPNLASLDKEN